ncbi:MAG: hypothetical protein H7844_03350 [Nitrospirae bacterium YQR-1]
MPDDGTNGSGIIAAGTKAPDVKQRIPQWYSKVLKSDSFAILPIVVAEKPAAVIIYINAVLNIIPSSSHGIKSFF